MQEIYRQVSHTRPGVRWLCVLLIVCSVLCGCTDNPCLDNSNEGATVYDRCLSRHESVTSATRLEPFTVLTISYDEPYGYWGAHLMYQRILHKDRVLTKKVDSVQPWSGLSNSVLFADFYEGDASSLHLIYEREGRPIVERIDAGRDGWFATHDLPYGFPLHPGVRYFPKYVSGNDAGFILSVLPTRVTILPAGPEGVRVPSVQSLAGIAPDGNAYAYADSRMTPSAVVVVDKDGMVHDPIPIPFTSLAISVRSDANPFEPLWHWFNFTFTWQKNERGRWEIVSKWVSPSATPANALEELFINAFNGYKACFVSDNPACFQGWKLQENRNAQSSDCCLSRYAYAPTKPTEAFSANVEKLVYSALVTSGSGYQMLLNAPPELVIATLSKRLKSRNVPFVRGDQCPDVALNESSCIAQMKQSIKWKDSVSHDVLGAIFSACEIGAVFVTPTVALAIYSAPNGQTWVDTLARYDQSAQQEKDEKSESEYSREIYHRS